MIDQTPVSTRAPLVRDTLTVCGIVLSMLAVVGLLVVARNLLPLVFGAILIAVVLNRFASVLRSLLPESMSRRSRVGLVVAALALMAVVFLFAFANSASEQIVPLDDRINASVDTVIGAAQDHPLAKRWLGENGDVASLVPTSEKSLGVAKSFFASAFGGLADCLILLILSIYFCFSPEKYRVGFIRLVPVTWRGTLSTLISDSSTTLWRWMLGRLFAMAIVGVLFAIGLAVIGIPMPIELGIFAALVTFIPNIGGVAAVIPALLLATQQGTTALVSVLVLYLAIQFAESYLVTPMVQEHQVSLPPALVILSQIVSGLVFGFWGIVFATPLMAIVQLWIKRLYVEDWLEA